MNARWGAREAPSRRTTPGWSNWRSTAASRAKVRVSRRVGVADARSVFTATSNGTANVGSCHVARWTVPYAPSPRSSPTRRCDSRTRPSALPSASATLRLSASASAFDASATVAKTHPAVEGETHPGARAPRSTTPAASSSSRAETWPGSMRVVLRLVVGMHLARPHHRRRRVASARHAARASTTARTTAMTIANRVVAGCNGDSDDARARTGSEGGERGAGVEVAVRGGDVREEGGERGAGVDIVDGTLEDAVAGMGGGAKRGGPQQYRKRRRAGDAHEKASRGFSRGSSASASRWARSRSGSHGAPSRVTEETRAGVCGRSSATPEKAKTPRPPPAGMTPASPKALTTLAGRPPVPGEIRTAAGPEVSSPRSAVIHPPRASGAMPSAGSNVQDICQLRRAASSSPVAQGRWFTTAKVASKRHPSDSTSLGAESAPYSTSSSHRAGQRFGCSGAHHSPVASPEQATRVIADCERASRSRWPPPRDVRLGKRRCRKRANPR